MTRKEAVVLLGIAGYIGFAIEKGLEFGETLVHIGHDVRELVNYGSLAEANKNCFLPRTHNYAKVGKDSKEFEMLVNLPAK